MYSIFMSNPDKQISYPCKLVWIIEWSQIGTVYEVQILSHGDCWAGQNGVEIECVAEILQDGGDRSGGRGEI